jgi:hypothetical protein
MKFQMLMVLCYFKKKHMLLIQPRAHCLDLRNVEKALVCIKVLLLRTPMDIYVRARGRRREAKGEAKKGIANMKQNCFCIPASRSYVL